MPDITVRVQGTAELRRALHQLRGAQRRQAQRDGLDAGARIVETYAKVAMSEEKSGRTYARGGREHRASAPGEAPAVDYGNLKSSIQVFEVTPERAIIGTNAEYAEHLEFGTSRMEPRPYMRPALDEHAHEIVAAIEDAVREFVESV
jgi:HK97 gp10 family phage protein